MAPPPFAQKLLKLILTFMLILCMRTAVAATSRTDDLLSSECLKVPSSEFVDTVKTTIGAVQKVATNISPFVNAFGDLRLSNAISDCLDLLDLSVDQLSWAVSAIQNPKGILIINI